MYTLFGVLGLIRKKTLVGWCVFYRRPDAILITTTGNDWKPPNKRHQSSKERLPQSTNWSVWAYRLGIGDRFHRTRTQQRGRGEQDWIEPKLLFSTSLRAEKRKERCRGVVQNVVLILNAIAKLDKITHFGQPPLNPLKLFLYTRARTRKKSSYAELFRSAVRGDFVSYYRNTKPKDDALDLV